MTGLSLPKGRVAIAHSFADRNKKELVITAATSDLQQLILEHATDEKAFADSTEFRKLK